MLSPLLAVVQQNLTSIQRWLQLAALNKFNLEHIVQCHLMTALGISIANDISPVRRIKWTHTLFIFVLQLTNSY